MIVQDRQQAPQKRTQISSVALSVPAPIVYAAAVFFDKSLSLLTIPLIASFLTPSDYGSLDIALNMIELMAIVMALGLADTLIRFSGTASSKEERLAQAGKLIGTSIPVVFTIGLAVQLLVPFLIEIWKITLSPIAVRVALLSAMMSGFLDLPLTWLRMQDRSLVYGSIIFGRVLLQLALMFLTLKLGYGAEGWLIASSLLTIALTLLTLTFLIREVGCSFATDVLAKLFTYALPLVGAALAAYTLNNMGRLYLANTITPSEVAQFTLASRLACAASLAMYPFVLWWGPRRMTLLGDDTGRAISATVWKVGLSIILIAGVAVSLSAPLFVSYALPPAYAGSTPFIPYLVIAFGIGQLAWLCSVGCYARRNGIHVLTIEALAAAITICAYWTFVSPWGIPGAITAMTLGQIARLMMFAIASHHLAPMDYPILAASTSILLSILLVALAPAQLHLVAQGAWFIFSLAALSTTLITVKLLPAPRYYSLQSFKRLLISMRT
jgi:O-antigen/teichoic acid export membrane protein